MIIEILIAKHISIKIMRYKVNNTISIWIESISYFAIRTIYCEKLFHYRKDLKKYRIWYLNQLRNIHWKLRPDHFNHYWNGLNIDQCSFNQEKFAEIQNWVIPIFWILNWCTKSPLHFFHFIFQYGNKCITSEHYSSST